MCPATYLNSWFAALAVSSPEVLDVHNQDILRLPVLFTSRAAALSKYILLRAHKKGHLIMIMRLALFTPQEALHKLLNMLSISLCPISGCILYLPYICHRCLFSFSFFFMIKHCVTCQRMYIYAEVVDKVVGIHCRDRRRIYLWAMLRNAVAEELLHTPTRTEVRKTVKCSNILRGPPPRSISF